MKKLLALLGLDARLRRFRIAAGEGALAAEDRAQLLRMAWAEERHRLRRMLLFVIAVIGLTTVMVAMLSVAVVVHFWDTPHRVAAAWGVAAVWVVLWALAMIGLVRTMRRTTRSVAALRGEFARDWRWIQGQIGARERRPEHREPRPATREELLARIERQRERVAQLQTPPPQVAPGAQSKESMSQTALRTMREHPVATAAVAAGAVAVLGPRRFARIAAWALPILWKRFK